MDELIKVEAGFERFVSLAVETTQRKCASARMKLLHISPCEGLITEKVYKNCRTVFVCSYKARRRSTRQENSANEEGRGPDGGDALSPSLKHFK